MQGESEKDMGTYREWIESLKSEWIGKRVKFEGGIYNVVDVDYNGFLLIDKKARYTRTTAVKRYDVEVRTTSRFLYPTIKPY